MSHRATLKELVDARAGSVVLTTFRELTLDCEVEEIGDSGSIDDINHLKGQFG